MKTWQELVKSALLGTEKTTFVPANLPPPVRRLMEKEGAAGKETFFLKAASLLLVYKKAGELPATTPLPGIMPAPEETRSFAPAGYTTALKRLLSETGNKFPDLYFLLFEKIRQGAWVLPHENIVQVLGLLNMPDFRQQKSLIGEIVGERGRWLMQFNPDWAPLVPVQAGAMPEEGTFTQRREALSALRNTDPEKAFDLIRSEWNTANARERNDFLKILTARPQTGEWAFIQEIYDSLPDGNQILKPALREIREMTVQLLLRSTNSTIFRTAVERLAKYTVVKKSFLGMQSKTILELPAEPDGFLNATWMKTAYCLDETPSTNELLTEYWFCFLLRSLHPLAWEQVLNTSDWHAILNIMDEADKQLGGKKKQQRQPFRWHLSEAMGLVQCRPAILAALDKYSLTDLQDRILDALTPQELENYCIKHIDMGEPGPLRNKLIRAQWRWSPLLSHHVLKGLIKNHAQAYYNSQFALNVAVHFDNAILPELYRYANQEYQDWQKQHLKTHMVLPLIQFMEFRKSIESI